MKETWLGRMVGRSKGILASSDVRFPLRLLHKTQAVAKFSQESSPPFAFGIMWSTVKDRSPRPQYWQR